ncbi:MAG: DEAD/DEAH box helicase family protein [Phycisphaerales bacterium]
MIELRPYQKQAINACYDYMRKSTGNGCIVLPTGSGKSVVLAQICSDAVSLWDGRVLVLTHVQELIEQNAGKIKHFLGDNFVGIYSAGLKQKDMHQSVIAASIQSIYKKAFEFEPFDLIIIDEAHLIATSGEGMYLSFLRDAKFVNPNIRIVGTTATPYRTGTGMICGPDNILNEICFEVGIKELIRDGFLCPLRSKASKTRVDTSSVHIRGGEFIANELEDLMDTDSRVKAACAEILEYTHDRNAVLIFAAGVEHGKHIQRIFQENHNIECGFVSGDSPDGWRKKMIEDFRSGKLKYLCNINVLTTGFDAPNIDCIAMLRPTMSPGLYYQMTGRGFRLHENKNDCLVLDFGGNILRHGPVDCLRVTDAAIKGNGDAPAKECPGCCEIIHAAYSRCPACGYEFPPPEKTKHETTATTEGILSNQSTINEYAVQEVLYNVHTKKGAKTESPRTMRVQYKIGFGSYISEWICFEHTGFARQKAVNWWIQRSDSTIPDDSEMAVFFATNGRLKEPVEITIKHIPGQKFDKIVGYKFDDPEINNWQLEQQEPQYVPADDEIPF